MFSCSLVPLENEEMNICHTDRTHRASIRDAVCLSLMDRNTALSISLCILSIRARQTSADTTANGGEQVRHISESILCVRFVRGTESTFKLRWLTIKNHTEVINNCSGIRVIGRAFASHVMIKRPGARTACRHIITINSLQSQNS